VAEAAAAVVLVAGLDDAVVGGAEGAVHEDGRADLAVIHGGDEYVRVLYGRGDGRFDERDYAVGEFPLLLTTTTNLYTFSDAGTPLGYSYVRIRGFDDKRVATYINGVPLNDPEDQATYFVDLPHYIRAFDVYGQHLQNGRLFAVVSPGCPDGIKLDTKGRVYTSSASDVQVFTPQGDLLGEIMAPGVANFTFGGPKNDVLFILGDTKIWQAKVEAKGVDTARAS